MAFATTTTAGAIRGDDVDGPVRISFLRISFLGHGDVWARITPAHAAYREHVEDVPYVVHCLGGVEAPVVRWGDLDEDTQGRLLAASACDAPEMTTTAGAIRARLRDMVDSDPRSAAAVAAAAGMSRQQFSQLLSGYRDAPSIVTVARVLAALGRSWRDLD